MQPPLQAQEPVRQVQEGAGLDLQGIRQMTSEYQGMNIDDQHERQQPADLPSLRTQKLNTETAWTQEDLDSSSPFHRASSAQIG